ncbi:MAG: flagellar motor protein MotB [Alphaproteobacteria bacterium]
MAKGANNAPVIIVKRVKKVGGGHHGGAWKVAYADFVTAMMAFFLLLWLLNATSEEQRSGISDYFAPTTVSDSRTIGEGAMSSMTTSPAMFASTPSFGSSRGDEDDDEDDDDDFETARLDTDEPDARRRADGTGRSGDDDSRRRQRDDGSASHDERSRARDTKVDGDDPVAAAAAAAIAERQQFEQAVQELRQALATTPELEAFKQSLVIDQTAEGLRIQIVDQDKVAMFPLGGAQMYPEVRELLRKVVLAVEGLPHKIAVFGHTDAAPFASDRGYSNWELSADRANASRRALVELGLPTARIARVGGLADTDPLVPEDPLSARNRRISITLLRQMSRQAALPAPIPTSNRQAAIRPDGPAGGAAPGVAVP